MNLVSSPGIDGWFLWSCDSILDLDLLYSTGTFVFMMDCTRMVTGEALFDVVVCFVYG